MHSPSSLKERLERFSYNPWVTRLVTVVMLYLAYLCIKGILSNYFHSYMSWGPSEMLINFQGGFVRRGLLGELAYQICSRLHLNPSYVIFPICIAAFLAVIIPTLYILRKWRVQWWLLVTTWVLGHIYPFFIRKDFVVLAVFVAILLIYRNPRLRSAIRLGATTILCIILLLVYEPAFFIFMPMMGWIIWRDETLTVSKAWKSISLVAILLTMAFILIFGTGSIEKAQAIQASWHALRPDRISAELSPGVWAIGWTIKDSLIFNDSVLLPWLNTLTFSQYISFLLIPVVFYYIFARYPYLIRYRHATAPLPQPGVWSTLILVQLLSLAPLWLGLSCDYARLTMYTVFTTFFFAYFLPPNTLEHCFPQKLQTGITNINTRIDQYLPPHFTVLALLLLFGIRFYRMGSPTDFFYNSPVYLLYNLAASLI